MCLKIIKWSQNLQKGPGSVSGKRSKYFNFQPVERRVIYLQQLSL